MRKPLQTLSCVIAIAISTAACQSSPSKPTEAAADKVSVPMSLTATDILAREAVRLGIHEEAAVKEAMAVAARERLAQELAARHLQQNPITEAEIKKLYNQFADAAKNDRYLIRQFTAPSEREAKTLARTINAGDAQKMQKMVGSEALWVTLDMFTSDIAQKLRGVKVSKASEPIEAQGRWRVIQVLDRQKQTIGTLDEVRPALKARLEQDRLSKLVERLRGSQ